jgi:hypothetical protein
MIKQCLAVIDEFKQFVNPIRPTIQYIKNLKVKNLIGIEIGVYRGHNALNIFQNLDIKKLILIDPYIMHGDDDGWIADESTLYDCVIRLKRHMDKVIWIRRFSKDAREILNEKVDFVYIDGNHAYEYVKNDIRMYFSIVKDGGIIGGHDYISCSGVADAVTEFCRKNKYTLHIKRPDWWIVK